MRDDQARHAGVVAAPTRPVATHPDRAARCGRAGAFLLDGGLLSLLWVGFYWRVLLTREASVPAGGGDFNSFYYPLARFAADQIQAGRLPLWNPTLHGGAPFAADFQAGLLYPPNLAMFLLARPFEYGALVLLALLHSWLASVTTYALWRGVGGGRWGGITAGLTYAYGGFLVLHLGHPPMLGVAAWLPLLLLCLARGLPALRAGWLAGAAGLVAVMILAGHPQLLLMGLAVAGLWSLAALWMARPRDEPAGVDVARAAWWRRGLARFWVTRLAAGLGVAVLGALLAAPVLLPALQLGQRSLRASLSYAESTAFSVRPMLLVQALVPKAFGDGPTSYLNAIGFSGEVWLYAGVIPLLLAGAALALRPRWPVLIGVALATLALLLALGPATPLHGWLYRFVPGFGQVRAPGRWSLVYSLGLALAAAGGVDALVALVRAQIADQTTLLRRAPRWLALAAGAVLLLLLLLSGELLGPKDPSAPLANFLDGLGWLVLLLLLAVAVTGLLRSRRLTTPVAGALLAGLVVLDLFSAHMGVNPTTADLTAGFQHPEIVAALRAAGPARLDADTVPPEIWQPSTAAVYGLRDAAGAYNPLGLADYAAVYDLARRDRAAPLYNVLGVSHLVARLDRQPRVGAVAPVLTTPGRLILLERREALPRVAVIGRARWVESPAAALAALRAPGFDPAREVILVGESPPPTTGQSAVARLAMIVRDEPDRLEVRATTDAPGWLVIADADYPGWRAEIDGQPAPVLRANYAFRAVTLPAGAHTVQLIFDPPLWRVGWLLAGLGALGLAGLVGGAVRQRRVRWRRQQPD